MLQYSGRFYCGGSLINTNYILTAAHCLRDFSTQYISITLLAHKLDGSTPGTFNERILKSIIHPLYNPSTFDNDIGLLQLQSSVNFDGILRPVCLPPSGGDYSGQMVRHLIRNMTTNDCNFIGTSYWMGWYIRELLYLTHCFERGLCSNIINPTMFIKGIASNQKYDMCGRRREGLLSRGFRWSFTHSKRQQVSTDWYQKVFVKCM